MHRAHEAARYPCLPPTACEKMSMLQIRFVSLTLGVAALLAPLLADARQAQTAKWVNVCTGGPRCLGEFTSVRPYETFWPLCRLLFEKQARK